LKRKEISIADESIDYFKIKSRGHSQKVKFLSGGNQQKVILARWVSSKKKILLLDEPTRGIDVMAKTEIYKLMNSLAKNGITILFSSSDIAEVLTVSDRIAAMRQGQIVRIFERDDFDSDKLLHAIMFDK
jgi:ABC-type sugar transport system ATPase subunit